jgi:uncharacterized protein YkwD
VVLVPALCAALLSACGAVAVAEPTPAPLPTAVIAARPSAAEVIAPTPPFAQSSASGRIAAAANTPPPSTPTIAQALPAPFATASPDEENALREALLVAEMNRVRSSNGLPPYQHSSALSDAARAHSCDLAAHAMISHTSSDGRALTDRLAGAAPPWEWPSESIAAGVDDPVAVVAMWMDEPPEGWHRRNILDVDQREVGVGYCYTADDPTGNHHYWTADFSRHP